MIVRLLKSVLGDNRGATAVEYGLIIALIVIAMVVSLTGLANTTIGMWGNVNTKVTTATAAK
ncbi:Flp family type IVb pilin [Sphingomonas glacialis]|uniref:Flp family type IVb pilin n=1 Tax=Sphingomonas glacialis TaxID=658225 RepID=A0A502G0A2_9SPHN|nr:Flp family type IVb pilin [Sphingomonas glacialis]TPG54553.1 Flp family type IVb pilin [Sphingomonas glacialis]